MKISVKEFFEVRQLNLYKMISLCSQNLISKFVSIIKSVRIVMKAIIILMIFSAQVFPHIMFVNDPVSSQYSDIESKTETADVTDTQTNSKSAIMSTFAMNMNLPNNKKSPEKTSTDTPGGYYLGQNSSKQAGPYADIYFSIPVKQHVKIVILNMLGQEIKQLISENIDEGTYKINFDASEIVSGLYVCRLETENFVDSKRMMLVK